MFIRVVHRQGWEVELVESGEVRVFESQEAAMAFARAANPDWIELGVVVSQSEAAPQHHRWTTLRRQSDGGYRDSGLSWGGKPV
jgi:hypothetical protein